MGDKCTTLTIDCHTIACANYQEDLFKAFHLGKNDSNKNIKEMKQQEVQNK